MKNKLLLIPLVVALTSCAGIGEATSEASTSAKPTYDHSLSVVAPVGAPALAFYNYAKDASFETNSDASNIVPMMKQGKKDIVVLPTNVGVKAIVNQNVDYKLAATITFGNLFVAETGLDNDHYMDKYDYIVLFQEGSVPDLIFHSIYGTELDETIHYVSNAQKAAQCLMTGKNVESNNEPVEFTLVAEPALTTVKSKNEKVKQYADLQQLYKEKFGSEIFQASVFVKNGVNADMFLSSLEEDINNVIRRPELFTEKLSGVDGVADTYGVEPEVAATVTKNNNRMGLGFKKAKENKEGIDTFLSIFGLDATSEEIYY